MNAIARRYAQALFEAAPTEARDAVARDLEAIARVVEDPAIRAAITDPSVPARVRRQACEKLGEGAHDVVKRLIGVLVARRRETVLIDLEPAFRALVLAARGEVEGLLETAKPLDAATVESLSRQASKLTGKTVLLRVEENPDLIGGVRMRVGNTLFDSSVATAIEELERRLMTAHL